MSSQRKIEPPGAPPEAAPPRSEITLHVCGTGLCTDGRPHDDLKLVVVRDSEGRNVGGSVACSRCGSSAMSRDMLRLP